MRNSLLSPFYRNPDHPWFNRRAFHHDYTRPAKYLITLGKNPAVENFCTISGELCGNRPGGRDSNMADWRNSNRLGGRNSNRPDRGSSGMAGESERADAGIVVNLSATGMVIPKVIDEWQCKYQIYVAAMVVMPDHVHLCIDVVTHLPNGFSRAMSNLMGKISSAYHHSLPECTRPPKMRAFFAKGFNDRIAYTAEQWENQKRYVIDNPRRYLIKKRYPDFMIRRWLLTMPDGRQFVARGNVFLLRQPELFRVKTSRRFTEAEAAACTDSWKRQLYNGGIPISPFIHPHEKELRDIAANEGFSYIRVCTNGFGEREAPSGRDFELMAEGRLLLIGQLDFSTRKVDLKYSFAQALNGLALEIARICNSGAALSLRPL